MSGFFGIFNRNGKAIEEEVVETMLDAMSYWDPDKNGTWSEGPAALGHAMLWNTPESKYEYLPLKKDAIVLTMDARIDNREELAKEIELPDRPMSKIGDSEFILGAYAKWGEECPKHLLGDFAFALWDEKKQQLFCARDHIGIKQLFYHQSDDAFIFGNDLKSLVEHPYIEKKINNKAVANYLVNYQLNSRTLTFFEGVKKLLPAHHMTVTDKRIVIRKYWNIASKVKLESPTINEYAKKLRELLEQAVCDRLRTDFPVSSHLSGGLDSSSVAVIAARKLYKQGKKLNAYNWIHEPTKTDDPMNFEWHNSKMISDIENIEHSYISMSAESLYGFMSERDIVYGETVDLWYEYPLRRSAQQKGSRTILSGWGGDEFVTYKGRAYYIDLVCKGRIIKAFRELSSFAKENNRSTLKSFISLLYFKVLMPCIPKKVYCCMPKNTCQSIKKFYPFLKKDFLPLMKQELKKASYLNRQSGRTVRDDMLTYWESGHVITRIESWETEATKNRLTYAYPMLDKRIIEFMLQVPAEYLVNDREGRYLFRLAMKEILPSEILWMGKEQEFNRVNHLMELLVSTYLIYLSRKSKQKIQSNYIEPSSLFLYLQHLQPDILSDDYLEINGLMSLLFSKTLSPSQD